MQGIKVTLPIAVVDLYNEGTSTCKIAKLYSISSNTVTKFLLLHGCRMRTNSEYTRTEDERRRMSESRKGRKVTEETRKKMREAIRKPLSEEKKAAKSAKLKSRVFSDETRKRMSESARRKPPVSEETRRKLGNIRRGRKHSVEAKKKISKSNKGRVNSKESIAKAKETRKWYRPSEETKAKIGAAGIGRKPSEEVRKRIREGLARANARPEVKARKSEAQFRRLPPSQETKEKIGIASRARSDKLRENMILRIQSGYKWNSHNSLENAFAKVLDNIGVEYKQQHRISRYLFDFYMPKYNLIIETHGDFWHANPKIYPDRDKLTVVQMDTIKKDLIKESVAIERGYRYSYFWEHDVHNNTDIVADKVRGLLSEFYC